MLNVIMLNVIMLNVIMLNFIMLNAIMLNVIMLNVIMLSVVMLSGCRGAVNANCMLTTNVKHFNCYLFLCQQSQKPR